MPCKEFPVFRKDEDKTSQVALIYAANGSGKTTFSTELVKQLRDQTCEVIDSEGNSVREIRQEDNLSVAIHLFNEDFVQQNLLIKDSRGSHSGLRAVALFGEQVSSENKVSELKDQVGDNSNQLEATKKRLDQITGNENGELDRWKQEFQESLQLDNGWADNVKKIRGMKKRPSCKDPGLLRRLKEIRQESKGRSGDDSGTAVGDLVAKREKLISRLRSVADVSQIQLDVERFELGWDKDELNKCLKTTPTAEFRNATAELIRQQLEKETGSSFREILMDLISHSDPTTCPLCAQTVDPPRLAELRQAFHEINEDSARKELRRKLERFQVMPPVQSVDPIQQLRGQLPEVVIDGWLFARQDLAAALSNLSKIIDSKINNLDSLVEFKFEILEFAIQAFEKARSSLSEAIEVFNNDVDKYEQLVEEALRTVDQIQVSDSRTAEALDTLMQLEDEKDSLEERQSRLKKELDDLNRQIQIEEAASKNFSIASELINKNLEAILGESNRLSVRVQDVGYEIISRGVTVPSDRLSTGERNILALAYFFVRIFENSAEYNTYSSQRLVILDDPMSSFDSDNKYGVFTFLRQMFRNLLSNQRSQLLVLSHDIGLIRDLHGVFRAINGISVATKVLDREGLRDTVLDNYQTYSELLSKIYRFASDLRPISGIHDADVPKGNELRLILELFAKFELNCDISSLLSNRVVRNALQEKGQEVRSYFDGPLYKLVLHGESHAAESVMSGVLDLTPAVSERERQDLCRDIICLISVISPNHLPSRLQLGEGRNLAPHEDIAVFNHQVNEWMEAITRRGLPANSRA